MADKAPALPLSALLRRLVDDLLLLFRSELRMASLEVRGNLAAARGSVAAIALGTMLLSVAMLCLLGGTVAFLAQSVGIVAAAFIVGAVATVIAGVLIAYGVSRLGRTELAPTRALAKMQRDLDALTGE
jgi:hypothetical protein